MWRSIANIILRNRLFILGIIALLTVFFGYMAFSNIKLENKYGVMLPNDSEATQNYQEFKDKFGEDGGTLVIAIQSDSLYTKNHFLKWKEMGDSILQIDGVEGVISEATLFTIKNNQAENKFEIQRIFSDISYQEKSIDSIEREIKNNPIYKNVLYNDDSNVSLMLVKVDEGFLSDKFKSKVVFDIEKVAEHYDYYFGKMHFSGLPHLRVIIGKRVQGEMYIFIGLSLLATSLLLFLFFRSIKVVAICLTVVGITVIWSMGTIGFLDFKLSILMALIPPLMIVIGIPNCVFLMTKFHQELKEHGNKVKALSLVIQRVGLATFLTNLTTALGFATFIFTNSEKLMEFGIVASINIMFVFIISICILPIISSFSKAPKEKHLKHLERTFAVKMIQGIVYLIQKKRPWVYITTLLLIFVSIVGMLQIKVTGNLTGDLPDTDPIKTDLEFIQNHFGGAIPYEVMIDYKEEGRLKGPQALKLLSKIDEAQKVFDRDSLFSQSISLVNFLKVVNMAYYGNDSSFYQLPNKIALRNLGKYIQNFNMTNANGGGLSIKELLDTNTTTLRIRCQMVDIGSYDVATKTKIVAKQLDSIFNPDKQEMERIFKHIKAKPNSAYVDTLFNAYPNLYNELADLISKNNNDLKTKFAEKGFDIPFIKSFYQKKNITDDLRKAIDFQYYDLTFTGTSVVASEGTQYLVINLFSSLLFAIILIAVLMALLFRSWRMVLISLIPNLIPLIMTAGIMGWFGIPLKPSTLLVFSIAFGISVDDTIHFLAKYRQLLKNKEWDIQGCIVTGVKESGLGMFYTSIVLFCGFSVFTFSSFGGTQALGLLISITLLIAMITNLLILPSLLMTLDRLVTTKSFNEPYFDAYADGGDVDWNDLDFSATKKPLTEENEEA